MYKRHFFRFSIALTLFFGVGIILLFVINAHDNAKYGESMTVTERISDLVR
ncbi:MAG: hypothetical protein KBB70_02185 [Candidatus Pacebacteria bacterium]|jgi:hypothetical protein|nr:hypothetical protein [Candidatus Paceibacterota bacterium]